MLGDDKRRDRAAGLPDAALWRLSRTLDLTEEAAEAERYLDLAGLADGRLDPEDQERVAEWLADDPVAAGDVAAARALALRAERLEAAPQSAVMRASALVEGGGGGPQRGTVIPFRPRRRDLPRLRGMAGWGSLVAAMAVASWLGFTLGMDTSSSFVQIRQAGDDGFLREFLDPSTGFMRDLTEDSQT
jgi:anti-sigma factor RsiW